MSKSETAPTAPTFDAVAPDAIPAAVRNASANTLATGTAILTILDAGNAAVDPTHHETRQDAVKRAAALKRAIAAVDNDAAVASRIYVEGSAFRVAILPKSPDVATPDPDDVPTA